SFRRGVWAPLGRVTRLLLEIPPFRRPPPVVAPRAGANEKGAATAHLASSRRFASSARPRASALCVPHSTRHAPGLRRRAHGPPNRTPSPPFRAPRLAHRSRGSRPFAHRPNRPVRPPRSPSRRAGSSLAPSPPPPCAPAPRSAPL